MKVRVITTITTIKGTTPAGAIIDIPESLIERLKGKIEPLPFNTDDWQTAIGKLAEEIRMLDSLHGSWRWLKQNQHELWNEHLSAQIAVDQSYQEQDEVEIRAAISRVRATFTLMLEAWQNRHHLKQSSLLAE